MKSFNGFHQIKPDSHEGGCMECDNQPHQGVVQSFKIGAFTLRLCNPCLRRLWKRMPAEVK